MGRVMPISLGLSLNKVVSVSIPSLFGDVLPRVCTLVGADTGGVWLQITDPSFKLFRNDISDAPAGVLDSRATAANAKKPEFAVRRAKTGLISTMAWSTPAWVRWARVGIGRKRDSSFRLRRVRSRKYSCSAITKLRPGVP